MDSFAEAILKQKNAKVETIKHSDVYKLEKRILDREKFRREHREDFEKDDPNALKEFDKKLNNMRKEHLRLKKIIKE